MIKNEIINTNQIPRSPDWENHFKSRQHVEHTYFTAGADIINDVIKILKLQTMD